MEHHHPSEHTMTIPQSEILDVIEEDQEDGTSIEDIFQFLLSNEDIILTIDASEEESLRRGLALIKHAHYKKKRTEGVKTEDKQISFKVLEEIANTDPKQIRIQIWLKKRSSLKVHTMIVSDKDI